MEFCFAYKNTSLRRLEAAFGSKIPVKVQCYRIIHVHNYHSFHFTTILWKILYLILFGHTKTDFVRYLISNLDLPQESTGINWQSVKWCKILNRSVSVIGLYVISFESTGLKLSRYKYLWLVYSAVWKLERSLHKSISWWLRLAQVFSDW